MRKGRSHLNISYFNELCWNRFSVIETNFSQPCRVEIEILMAMLLFLFYFLFFFCSSFAYSSCLAISRHEDIDKNEAVNMKAWSLTVMPSLPFQYLNERSTYL